VGAALARGGALALLGLPLGCWLPSSGAQREAEAEAEAEAATSEVAPIPQTPVSFEDARLPAGSCSPGEGRLDNEQVRKVFDSPEPAPVRVHRQKCASGSVLMLDYGGEDAARRAALHHGARLWRTGRPTVLQDAPEIMQNGGLLAITGGQGAKSLGYGLREHLDFRPAIDGRTGLDLTPRGGMRFAALQRAPGRTAPVAKAKRGGLGCDEGRTPAVLCESLTLFDEGTYAKSLFGLDESRGAVGIGATLERRGADARTHAAYVTRTSLGLHFGEVNEGVMRAGDLEKVQAHVEGGALLPAHLWAYARERLEDGPGLEDISYGKTMQARHGSDPETRIFLREAAGRVVVVESQEPAGRLRVAVFRMPRSLAETVGPPAPRKDTAAD
jgi:hypothetical protein